MFVPDIDICSCADDTDTINILKKLESSVSPIAGWFKDYYMRLNREKCHFMVFADKSNDLTIQIETIPIGSFQPTEANGCQVMSSDFVDFCTVGRYL